MTPDELKARTQKLSFDKATRNLPTDTVTREIVRQLVRSGSSVGANYRSGCRARSDKEFIAKLGMVEDEADETMFWLELLAFVARNRKLRRKPGRNHQSTITNESTIPNPQSQMRTRLDITQFHGLSQRGDRIACRHEFMREIAGEAAVDNRSGHGGPVQLLRIV